MGLFTGKKGVVMGVANEYSIAAGVAKYLAAEGAEMAFSHLPDKDGKTRMAKRVERVVNPLGAKLLRPCDVANDDDVVKFFCCRQGSDGQDRLSCSLHCLLSH